MISGRDRRCPVAGRSPPSTSGISLGRRFPRRRAESCGSGFSLDFFEGRDDNYSALKAPLTIRDRLPAVGSIPGLSSQKARG
jgi:hypothetical protein